jgi:hypothetical protein
MTDIDISTPMATALNPAPMAEPNPPPSGTANEQQPHEVDPERLAELERKLEEAKRQLADSTIRIERALGR